MSLQRGTSITSRESTVARSFVALASGDAVARGIAFLAGVYVARALGAEMFGVMMFGQAVVLYFTHMAVCGVELTGMREIAVDERRATTLAPTILTVRLLVSIGLMVLLSVGALLVLPRLEAIVVALYALTLFGHGPNPRFVLLGLSQPKPVALSRTVGELVYLALVLLCVRLPLDVITVPWAQFVGDALAVAVMLYWLKRRGVRMPLALDWPAVEPLFRRSFPLVVNILLGLLIYNSDLIVLRFYKDSTTVGWYSAAYQLISFLINMSSVYSYSLLPSLTQAAAQTGERRALYQTALAQTFAVSLPIAVGGGLVAHQLIALVFGSQYGPSGLPLIILISSIPFMLYKDVAMIALVVSGRENFVMRVTAVGVVFNLVGNIVLVPHYGMTAAASTTVATEVLRCVLMAGYARREGFALAPAKRLVKSVIAACAMAAVVVALGASSLFVLLAAGAASYAIALLLAGGIQLRRGALPALKV